MSSVQTVSEKRSTMAFLFHNLTFCTPVSYPHHEATQYITNLKRLEPLLPSVSLLNIGAVRTRPGCFQVVGRQLIKTKYLFFPAGPTLNLRFS